MRALPSIATRLDCRHVRKRGAVRGLERAEHFVDSTLPRTLQSDRPPSGPSLGRGHWFLGGLELHVGLASRQRLSAAHRVACPLGTAHRSRLDLHRHDALRLPFPLISRPWPPARARDPHSPVCASQRRLGEVGLHLVKPFSFERRAAGRTDPQYSKPQHLTQQRDRQRLCGVSAVLITCRSPCRSSSRWQTSILQQWVASVGFARVRRHVSSTCTDCTRPSRTPALAGRCRPWLPAHGVGVVLAQVDVEDYRVRVPAPCPALVFDSLSSRSTRTTASLASEWPGLQLVAATPAACSPAAPHGRSG